MNLEVYIELITIIVAFITVVYIFGFIRITDHKLGNIWLWFFLAYIVFILTQLTRILDLSGIATNNLYRVIGRLLFYVILLISIIKFNKEIRDVIHSTKTKKRR